MIVETAFHRLPEILVSESDYRDLYESTLVHFFSMSLLMELFAKNIEHPYDHIRLEKPYSSSDNLPRRVSADLFLNSVGALRNVDNHVASRIQQYGAREHSWVEAKAFFASMRKGVGNTTDNAAKTLRDILRICLLPDESQSSHRINARYLLLASTEPLAAALGTKRATRNSSWIAPLVKPGEGEIHFSLQRDEGVTFRRNVGYAFEAGDSLSIDANVSTLTFQPKGGTTTPKFWGALVRVGDYEIRLNDSTTTYEDELGDAWDANRCQQLAHTRSEFLKRTERRWPADE